MWDEGSLVLVLGAAEAAGGSLLFFEELSVGTDCVPGPDAGGQASSVAAELEAELRGQVTADW